MSRQNGKLISILAYSHANGDESESCSGKCAASRTGDVISMVLVVIGLGAGFSAAFLSMLSSL